VDPVHALINACPAGLGTPATLLKILYDVLAVVTAFSATAAFHNIS